MDKIMLIGIIICLVCVIGMVYIIFELSEVTTNLEMEFYKFNKDLVLLADVLKESREYIEALVVPTINNSFKNDEW